MSPCPWLCSRDIIQGFGVRALILKVDKSSHELLHPKLHHVDVGSHSMWLELRGAYGFIFTPIVDEKALTR
jgi:hypothetical protein